MPGVGDEFRAAREARHLTVADVSDQIHIRSVYLENIEADDAGFAAPVYVRGFIRTYARFLGLDPEAAVAQFRIPPASDAHHRHDTASSFAAAGAKRGPSPWLWAAGLAVVVLVAFVGVKYFQFQQSGAPPDAVVGIASPSPSPSPVPVASAIAAAPATPDATPAPEATLEVRVTADSWMSVKIDGASRLVGIVKAGTTKAFHGKRADVRAGNAGGVDLTVNGKELGKMGNPGDVVERNLTLAEQ